MLSAWQALARRFWLAVFLTAIMLSTCASGPRSSREAGLILGPLVQLREDGRLRLVWWTGRAGQGTVRLHLNPPVTVPARALAWQARASPPLDRAWQHVATLPDLPAGETVPYTLYLDAVPLNGGRAFVLRVPPSRPPVRLAIIGDYGAGTPWARQVHDVVAAMRPDVVLTAGDNAYNRGRYDEFRTRVFALYGDLMAEIPFMPSIGNHDNATAHARPYLDFFVLPETAWRASERERYYSFDLANVHVVVLDTTDALAGVSDLALDDMADWLAEDLRRTRQPWRVAVFHHPPYSAGAHGSDRRVRQVLVPILEAGGVQWVFNGHEHDYQRTCPIREGRCVSPGQGPVYVITGGGGAWLRPTGQAWFTAKALSVHEAAFLTVDRCQAVLEVRDGSGRVIDRFVQRLPVCQKRQEHQKYPPTCLGSRHPWRMRHFPQGI